MRLLSSIAFVFVFVTSLASGAAAGIDEDAVKAVENFGKTERGLIETSFDAAEAKKMAAEGSARKDKAISEIKTLRSLDASIERRYRRIVKILDDYTSGEILFVDGKSDAVSANKKSGFEQSLSRLRALKAKILQELEESFKAARKAKSPDNPPVESVDTPRFDKPTEGPGRGIFER